MPTVPCKMTTYKPLEVNRKKTTVFWTFFILQYCRMGICGPVSPFQEMTSFEKIWLVTAIGLHFSLFFVVPEAVTFQDTL
jgi:hypothetical protein